MVNICALLAVLENIEIKLVSTYFLNVFKIFTYYCFETLRT